MDCNMVKSMMDAYIDDELTDAEMNALAEHAKVCEECKIELKVAEVLRDTLKESEKHIDVPLNAQAAWRKAVRTEAKKRSTNRYIRLAYVAAAVLVVVLCGTLVLNRDAQVASLNDNTALELSLIAKDGETVSVENAAQRPNEYDVWKKIEVSDIDNAARDIENLVSEYSGTCVLVNADSYIIELPSANLEDFISAVSVIGIDVDVETSKPSTDTAVIYIQLSKAE